MIYFLTECSLCKDNGIFSVIYIVKQIMNVIFILVPIILIVLVTVDLAKNVVAGKEDDMKKNKNIAIKRIIYAIAIFFVPVIVNVIMNMVYRYTDGSSQAEFSRCWQNATKENVSQCNKEALANQKAEDEKKKQESDAKKNNYEQKVTEENASRERNLGPGTDNNSESDNSNSNTSTNSYNTNDNGGNTSANYTIYVGDSRTVRMCSYVTLSSNETCVAEESKGITWLNATAYGKVVNILKKP